MEIFNKLSFLWRKDQFDSSLNEEVRFHLEERADELMREGIPRQQALRKAKSEFGSVSRLAEETRQEWQLTWLEDLWSDLRYAARSLRRDPGFLAVAVLSLAFGIGVNTAVFSLTMEFLASQASVQDPGTLYYARLGGSSHINLPQLQFLQDAKPFTGIAGLLDASDLNWRNGEQTQRLFGFRVTDNFFQLAGIPLQMGRPITTGDTDVVVISHRMWTGKLAADPQVLGRSLDLDGRPHTIIGLLPPDHRTLVGFGLSPDLYAPVRDPNTHLRIYIRAQNITGKAAILDRLRLAGKELDRAMPEPNFKYAEDIQLVGISGLDSILGTKEIGLFFAMLMAIVTLLLGIACFNVCGLLLARASARTHEFAVRSSLGAGSGRLVRQLLTESLLLSLTGAALGLLLNLGLTRLIRLAPLTLPVPIVLQVEPDWRLLAYTSAIAVGCALLVGLLPAFRASRQAAGQALKGAEHQVGSKLNLRRALVVAQVASSIIVLVTAMLFARNLFASLALHPGFDLEKTLYVSMQLVKDKVKDAAQLEAFARQAQQELQETPGVTSSALTQMIPFNDDSSHGGAVSTSLSPTKIPLRRRYVNPVGPGYFKTLGIPLLAGREFAREKEEGVVINESLARAAFGNTPAVGNSINFGNQQVPVIGVVRDSKYAWMSEQNRPASFESYSFVVAGRDAIKLQFLVRTGVDPESLVQPLLRKMSRIDPSVAVEVKAMKNAMGFALLPSRAGSQLLGAVGLVGLTLTGIGLYGLLSFSVTRRVKEIGLRLALGAQAGQIRRLVFGEGLGLVLVGLAIGLVAAYFLTTPLARFLVEGVSNADPVTYVVASALVLLAGWLACAVPARRALRIAPLAALRHDQ